MITWNHFPFFAYPALALWAVSSILALIPAVRADALLLSAKTRSRWFDNAGVALGFAGFLTLAAFTGLLWQSLGRPPLRTLGETRLWYALFLPPIGLVTELRWRFRWMRAYSLLMASLFVILNLAMPDTHDQSLAPALQSPWFVPHVIVYIVGYALLGASAIIGIHGIIQDWRKKNLTNIQSAGDVLAVLGFVFINLGLIFGAFWAKEAWGHYWTWDPKETWAFLTWLAYLVYIHLSTHKKPSPRTTFWMLTLGFMVLLICWFGMSYLAVSDQSVHSYKN
jgi:ABC-type transport system involved in cytochrome c biogenesis permease subunit